MTIYSFPLHTSIINIWINVALIEFDKEPTMEGINMNTKSNERFQKTEDRIFTIYLQLLKEKKKRVTVQQICDRGGFNRSTFYLHFLDIVDLEERAVERILIQRMQKAVKEEMHALDEQASVSEKGRGIEEHDVRQTVMRKYMMFMLDYMKQHQEEYCLLWASYEGNYMERKTEELFRKVMMPYLESYGIKDKIFMWYLFSFFHSGFFAVAKIWLIGGCRETPEALAGIIFSFLPYSTIVSQGGEA